MHRQPGNFIIMAVAAGKAAGVSTAAGRAVIVGLTDAPRLWLFLATCLVGLFHWGGRYYIISS